MGFEHFVGIRYLKIKPSQAFISLITLLSIAGVTVGVMALIVVIAVMAGFEADLRGRIVGVESHLVIQRPERPFKAGHPQVTAAIGKQASIMGAMPFVESQVMLRSAGRVAGARLKGVEPADAATVIQKLDVAALKQSPPPAAADKEDAAPGMAPDIEAPPIVLGKELARHLGVIKGDALYVVNPRGMLSPMGHVPAMKRFTVAGYFESGMYEYDSSLSFIALGEAQRLLRAQGRIDGIDLRLDDLYAAETVAEGLRGDLDDSYRIRSWGQMNKNLFSALKLEKTVMFIILALIVLVAAFNIASSLIMMVIEKTKDIAILKAMGATSGSIRKIFVLKGMAIGIIGTAAGTLAGVALCWALKHYQFIELPGDVYYITTLPVVLKVRDVIAIAGAAILICFVSTLYPATQAARLQPVEAIRYG
jgi:lipoprotein-releasing system permease protein